MRNLLHGLQLIHRFNILEHDVLKLYQGIRNVILRVSPKPGTGLRAQDGKDAILLGAHIDSTLPAPGAAEYIPFTPFQLVAERGAGPSRPRRKGCES